MEAQPRFDKSPARNPLPWKEFLQLPAAERRALMETTAREVLDFLRERAVEYKNMNEFYKTLGSGEYIVRRDSPGRILEALEHNTPLHITFPEGQRYSNAVLWSPPLGSRGLENAYLEGYGQSHGLVTVVGIRRDALTDVVRLPDAAWHFAGLDRTYVRSVQGRVAPKNIVFVATRTPADAFPKNEMTDEERDRYEEWLDTKLENKRAEPLFVHRGYLFIEHLKKQQPPHVFQRAAA